MKLTFYSGRENEVGIFETKKEAQKYIYDFLKDHNYTSYYMKISEFKDKFVYDFGSWSEFFILYLDNNEELNKRKPFEE